MTGLMAAQQLPSAADIILLDKNEKVGGRMSTHSIGPGRADVGAQFFTVHTAEFEKWTEKWLAESAIQQWSTGWSDASLTEITSRTYRRFIVKQGMSRLAEYLARPLPIETSSRVEHLAIIEKGWLVHTADGRQYASRALLLTPPVPLVLRLLESSKIELSSPDRAALQSVAYDPCLVAVFQLDGETKLPGLGAMQLPQGPIRYLVDNRLKGVSPGATLLTTQADTDFSRRWWQLADEEILLQMETELKPYLLPKTNIIACQIHRWRYALPTQLHPQRYLVASDLPPLLIAGDSFGSLRGIEGSALSGLAAGQALTNLLQQL